MPKNIQSNLPTNMKIVSLYGSGGTGKTTTLKILANETSLEELSAYAEKLGAPELPGSGKQESLESIVNSILFG